MSAAAIRIAGLAGAPEVRVIDARSAGLDEHGLRYPYALVSWHRGRVGIDIERVEP
jgi:hypothetical protein